MDDILEALNLHAATAQQEVVAMVPETAEEAALIALLEDEPCHIDEIQRRSHLPMALVSATLALLELKGVVRQIGGMHYVLVREAQAPYRLSE